MDHNEGEHHAEEDLDDDDDGHNQGGENLRNNRNKIQNC